MSRTGSAPWAAASVLAVCVATIATGPSATAAGGPSPEKGKPDQPVTRLVTKALHGSAANDSSVTPQISGDCTAVGFTSGASNLVLGDSMRWTDVFIRDRGQHRISWVSQGLRGARANGDSRIGDVNSTGRFVVYDSNASNLVPGDTNGHSDVFIRDLRRHRSELVSDAMGTDTTDGNSFAGSVSANGRYVVFSSDASNLVPGDTNTFFDVFVRDRLKRTMERISVPAGGGESDEASFEPSISANGRYVTFESVATNLVPGDTDQLSDIFRFDRRARSLMLVTATPGGSPVAFGGSMSDMSEDGSTVSFWTPDGIVAGDDNDTFDVFVRDIAAETIDLGGATDAGGFPAAGSSEGSLSADGSVLAFMSRSTDVAAPDTSANQDVFLHDRDEGTTLVSQSTRGVPADADSFEPSVSDDGRCIAFTSGASNLARPDHNGGFDIYLRRLPR
jgi:Tol biopolymer transport system component